MGNNDVYGGIEFEGNDTDTNANGIRGFIRGLGQGTGGGMKMEFGTAGGGAAIGSARMTLDADGNVKIGPDAQDIQLLPASTNSGVNTVYLRGNASNDKSTVTLNHYGVRAFDISAGVIGSGLFHIGNGASDPAFVIDGSSNVGIGTSNPAELLSVYHATNSRLLISTGAGGASQLYFGDNGSNLAGRIYYDHNGNSMRFHVNADERMRIDSSGRLLVNTTTAVGAGVTSVNRSGEWALSLQDKVNNQALAYFSNPSATTVGTITHNGSSVSYNTSSDYRLKTDAQPMVGATARVQALNPVNFEWIVDGTRVDGFLAHEAATVVPEAVHGTKDAMMDQEYEVTPAVIDENGTTTTEAVMGTRSVPYYQGIDQSKIVPLLTAALREALTKIDDMETRLAALEDV